MQAGNEKGQTLVEFVLIVPVLATVLIGSGWLLAELHRRTECSRKVFEAVRGTLEGMPAIDFRIAGGILRESEEGVEGKLRCGKHVEFLFLPKIDRRRGGR